MALPSDSLHARGFAADPRTLRALREALTGRKAKVQRGRLSAAIRTLAVEPAARLLFVDLDGVADPEVAARELAAVCAFETTVIAIGSTDTAQFTRTLFQHGVADYLLKPISPTLVREVCASVTDDLPERSYAGRVVAFSGSAGSGTSTLVAGIARALAAKGRTASVVDLDPISPRLPALLGVEPADGLSALLTAFDSGAPEDTETDNAVDQVEGLQADVGRQGGKHLLLRRRRVVAGVRPSGRIGTVDQRLDDHRRRLLDGACGRDRPRLAAEQSVGRREADGREEVLALRDEFHFAVDRAVDVTIAACPKHHEQRGQQDGGEGPEARTRPVHDRAPSAAVSAAPVMTPR